MSQLNFHNSFNATPPQRLSDDFPLLSDLKECYKLWHGFFGRIPKLTRHSLGAKIENILIYLVEAALTVKYAKSEEKYLLLNQISKKLDGLKYFTTVLWELKGLGNNEYAQLAEKLSLIGRMIGALIKNCSNKLKQKDG